MKKVQDFPEYSEIARGRVFPGGFNIEDKKQAVKIYMKLKKKFPDYSDQELWLLSVNAVIDIQGMGG